MTENQPFDNWQALLDAPSPEFARGHTADTVFDRAFNPGLAPMTEALFTQSNGRVLIGQSANGSFRMIALPTQVYAAPTGMEEFGLGPGMYHHFDAALYAGDLTYQIFLDGSEEPIDLAADGRDNVTTYADYFLPLTRTQQGDLDIALLSFAPVAPDASQAALAPAPLPGPAGAFYLLRLHNTGKETIQGRIGLKASDLLAGHYEDAEPEMRPFKQPEVNLRQNTLILTRPEGSVGIHLHEGRWVRTEAPFQAEKAFRLAPGEEAVFETCLAIGATYAEVMPVVFHLHLHAALDWLNWTAGYWRSRLGWLYVEPDEAARFSREIYIRSLFDNFNCLQTDADGNLISHWQGAPSHGYGTVWGIDVEPTAASIVYLCPEMARQAMLFFMTRSRAPRGPADHSVPILVAPVIIARQWLQATGDLGFFQEHPEVLAALLGIMRDLIALKAPDETLFPSRYSSDGPVGRRYDYGTQVKVWYAFDSMAYLLEKLGQSEEAVEYRRIAGEICQAIARTMAADGPFGAQISGGTNLGEDPGNFYLPENTLYYDGEDTSSMLAPIYGITDFDDPLWINYHRFARSLWCQNYDPEFETLQWRPSEPAVLDGTAYLSRLGGCITREEMRDALEIIQNHAIDKATGSLFWWPHGDEFRRGITRCSQGQGAWAWQYRQQWLGIQVDAPARSLTVAPRGLLTRVEWENFACGQFHFGIHWRESQGGIEMRIRNHNAEAWTLQAGFRQPFAWAKGPLSWQTRTIAPGEEVTLTRRSRRRAFDPGFTRKAITELEAKAFTDEDGILFKRFGPAVLWGHWDGRKLWDMAALPLSLRFLVLNATGEAWQEVTVILNSPKNWEAHGRQPGHWTRPDDFTPGEIMLELDELPDMGKVIAPFWVKAPQEYTPAISWNDPNRPFHAPSQPGGGISLYGRDLKEPVAVSFIADLYATTFEGKMFSKRLVVPVRILPAGLQAGKLNP